MITKLAKRFNCSEERIKEQYAANYKGLLFLLNKAKAPGKKVNGYTEQQLRENCAKYKSLAGL